jgi:hypothetical protein
MKISELRWGRGLPKDSAKVVKPGLLIHIDKLPGNTYRVFKWPLGASIWLGPRESAEFDYIILDELDLACWLVDAVPLLEDWATFIGKWQQGKECYHGANDAA